LSEARYCWLVSYPRSGNTWLRLLLDSLWHQGSAVDISSVRLRTPVASRREFDEYMGIESGILLDQEIEAARPAFHRILARNFDGPLILRKVHERCWITQQGERVFPPELSRGAVYLARDPRDVAVSCADFFGLAIDETIRRMGDHDTVLANSRSHGFMQLPQPLGSWSQHVTSWLDNSKMPVHIIRYEDLLEDTAGELRKVATFLELPAEAAVATARVVTFHSLQAQEEQRGFAEQLQSGRRFFRQGRSGAWRETLSVAQVDRLRRDHEPAMNRLCYT
jgi:aryl sulfotransferase